LNREKEHGRHADAACPSCGRFIGPADECPYCGTDSARPSFLKWLRWGAVGFSLVGVGALILAASRREIPRVGLGAIGPAMRYARVEVQGAVERDAYVGERDGHVDYVGFTVVDGTQSVRVVAYGEVAVALVQTRHVPKAHEAVTASGRVVVGRDGRLRLRLDAAEDLRLAPRCPSERPDSP